ncbi:hypothetical protein DKX38_015337 [Salix brachista]|uniref:CCHC-type domain-containing protein n=1 Tax=Salix brachista TaxID=2182728 RepID=A0A5N5L4X5_9ROSI|nr:hypothetical protein DKX38_015337 [Salix brachista]
MAGTDVKASGIEKFDGTDYGYWRMQIEDYLYGKKLHLPLLGTKPDNITATDWTLLDRQVLGVIRLTLSRSVAHNVIKEKTTVDLMTALSGMYEKPSANNKVHLMKKLFNLRMSDDMSVAQHLNDFNTITNQLSSVEIEFDDEIRALIILASLPNSWEAMRMVVSNSAGKSKLNYDDIRDLILAEEVRRRDSGEISGSRSALNVDSRGRAQNRNLNRGRSKSRGISKSRLGHQATCWNCGKTGHIKRNCKNPRKAGNDNANVVTEEVQDALLLAVHSPVEDWILDSGASFHTSSHRELMQNYIAGDFGKVFLVDGEALNVVGMGDVDVALPNRNKWTLQKVRHIPELKKNLISVGQLDDCGFSVVFSNGTWRVTKGALVLAKGKKTGTLYTTTGSGNTIFATVAENIADLWHFRLGHMSQKGMKQLQSKGKLPELKGPSVPLDCELPEEVWSGKEVNLSYLKTFGCLTYVLVNSNARNKLEAKSRKCYFIGYGDEAFGYRFWDDQGQKIIRSRNVIFNEKIMYKNRTSSDVEEALQEPDFVRLDNLPEVTVDLPEVTVDLPEVTVHERDVSDGESGSSTSTSIIPLLNPEPNVPTAEIRRWWRTTKLPGNLAR